MSSLIDYFEGFRFKDGKEKKNFDNLKEILSKEGEMIVHDDIIIDNLVIPNIGPSKGLLNFHLLLKEEDGWNENEIKEVEKLCNIHFGNLFSDEDECLHFAYTLQATKTFKDNNHLKNVIAYLEGKATLVMDDVYNLSAIGDLFASSIARYVLEKTF